MKNRLAVLLGAVLVICLCLQTAASSAAEVDLPMFMNPVNITAQTGANVGTDGFHSGHQTRIVHTEHGDYVALLTRMTEGNFNMNEFSLLKIADGRASILYQDIQCYNSSSISIFQDEKGEVYAATVLVDAYNTSNTESMVNLAVYHIDAKTDEIKAYKATIPAGTGASYGYGQPVIDTASGKIYAVISRGNGDNDGYLHWFIFDLATMRWEPKEYGIECHDKYRYMYHYLFADGKGGFYMVTQRNQLAANMGHPELHDNPIHSIDFLWDALAYYYIPNAYDDSTFCFQYIEEGDYSRIKDLDGDGKYDSDEERQTNQYPAVVNNHYGDTFVDSAGLMHVLYTVVYDQDAYGDQITFERSLYHATYDISDLTAPKLLSKDQLYFDDGEGAELCEFEMRMTQGTDGTLYIVACNCNTEKESYGRFQLYQLSEKEDRTYTYDLLGMSDDIGADWGFSLANTRSLSVEDDTVRILYRAYSDDTKLCYEVINLKGDPQVKDTTQPAESSETSSEESTPESSEASSPESSDTSSAQSSETSSQATSSQASSGSTAESSISGTSGGRGWIAIPIVAIVAVAAGIFIAKKKKK